MTKNAGTSHLRMQFFSYLGKYGTIIALGVMILCFQHPVAAFSFPGESG